MSDPAPHGLTTQRPWLIRYSIRRRLSVVEPDLGPGNNLSRVSAKKVMEGPGVTTTLGETLAIQADRVHPSSYL